jgi:Uma2 family endonuclease
VSIPLMCVSASLKCATSIRTFLSVDGRDQEQEEIIQYPCLIVEVLSPSTEAYDRGRKLAFYRQCLSIREYVLVDSQRQTVEVFRREKNTFWTYHAFGPGDDVEVASLGVRFPLVKLYRNVVLAEDES